MNSYIVYIHTFPNEKVYIGITKNKPCQRWSNGNGYKTQQLMARAIEKYGWDNVKHEILFKNLSKEEAQKKEIELIAQYKSTDRAYGYNFDYGGNLRGPVSEETKAKLSQFNLGKVMSPEVRAKISQTTKGKAAYWYGRRHTEKTKKLISENRKGKGGQVPFTEERKEKIRQTQMGNQNAPQKTTRCIETGIVYHSAREAARQTGLRSAAISECCRGVRQTYGGFHWENISEG